MSATLGPCHNQARLSRRLSPSLSCTNSLWNLGSDATTNDRAGTLSDVCLRQSLKKLRIAMTDRRGSSSCSLLPQHLRLLLYTASQHAPLTLDRPMESQPQFLFLQHTAEAVTCQRTRSLTLHLSHNARVLTGSGKHWRIAWPSLERSRPGTTNEANQHNCSESSSQSSALTIGV